jgi:hypothetical protein
MIIPSKHSGYRAGIRLYPGGGGDGPGGGGDPSTGGDARAGSGFAGTGSGLAGTGAGAAQAGVGGGQTGYGLGNYASSTIAGLMGTDSQGNARAGTNAGQIGGFDGGGYGGDNTNNTVTTKTQPTGTTAGASVIAPDNATLKAMQETGQPYDKLGGYYNSFLQQGYSDSAIRNALRSQGQRGGPSQPISDTDYEVLIQNAGMTSPTGRPMAGSGQFTQPVYNSQYQNYARPSTQFSTSLYGTQPMRSPAFNSGMSRGNINQTIGDFYKTNPRADANSALDFMRSSGVNREDFQAYGGLNNYGPQMSAPSMQTQQSFNPYTNAPQQQYNPFGYQQQPQQQQYSPFSYQQPQQQQYSPFSYQQPQQQQYSPFSYQQQQPQYSPFSYQQPQSQRRELNPYQQYENSLGSYNPYSSQEQYNPYSSQDYNPYQMQSPFSYQQPRYDDSYQQPQQPVVPTSSGPSKAIVGRSSSSRGTPNVMRRAEGGIAGILKK